MSITELEMERFTEAVREDLPLIRAHLEKAEQFASDPETFARNQGSKIATRLMKCVNCDEGFERFNSYFVNTDPHHALMHDQFWKDVTTQFPGMTEIIVPGTDGTVRQYSLTADTVLIARTDLDHQGGSFATAYEALHQLPLRSEEMLGNIATAMAMQ